MRAYDGGRPVPKHVIHRGRAERLLARLLDFVLDTSTRWTRAGRIVVVVLRVALGVAIVIGIVLILTKEIVVGTERLAVALLLLLLLLLVTAGLRKTFFSSGLLNLSVAEPALFRNGGFGCTIVADSSTRNRLRLREL